MVLPRVIRIVVHVTVLWGQVWIFDWRWVVHRISMLPLGVFAILTTTTVFVVISTAVVIILPTTTMFLPTSWVALRRIAISVIFVAVPVVLILGIKLVLMVLMMMVVVKLLLLLIWMLLLLVLLPVRSVWIVIVMYYVLECVSVCTAVCCLEHMTCRKYSMPTISALSFSSFT